jgi:alkylhydroperoxidase family enzyme
VHRITPDEATGEVAETFGQQIEQFGRVSEFYQVLANAPAAIAAWTVANRGLRLRYLTEDPEYVRIEQMVIIKTSDLNGSQYCLGHNVDLGLEVGLTPEQIDAVRGDYATSPHLDEAQRCAVQWAAAVTEMTAKDDDDLFARMQQHFSDRQIVELTVLVGMWNYSNRLTQALHVELEPAGCRLRFYHEDDTADEPSPAGSSTP